MKNLRRETARLPEHQCIYFLCEYVQYKDTWKADGEFNQAYKILRPLDSKYVPELLTGPGEYFVIEVVRRIAVVAHVHETTYTREELDL